MQVDGDNVTVSAGVRGDPQTYVWKASDPIGNLTLERLSRRYRIPKQKFFDADRKVSGF